MPTEGPVRRSQVVVAGFVVALLLAAPPAVAGASLPWEPVPPPATFGGPFSGWDEAWAVDCVDQTFCMATGGDARIARWDGSVWTELPRALLSGDLRSVSCASRSFCLAVGWLDANALILRWNGSAWTVLSPPTDLGQLGNVDCTSSTFCLMTGTDATAAWDGTSVSLIGSPYAAEALEGGLDCISPTFCVGTVGRDGWFTTGARIFHWNGSNWTPAFSSVPGGAEWLVSDVSCQTTTACRAVGFEEYENANLRAWVFLWNGTSWVPSLAAEPSGSTNNILVGVSCESAADCVAVGARGGDALACCDEPWVIRWSPGLPAVTVADPSLDLDILRDVDCVTPFGCVAVGSSLNDPVAFAPRAWARCPACRRPQWRRPA